MRFYTLDSDGDLHGPVSPATQGDMPILSGPGALKVQPSKLIDFAEALVRAEATLGAVVSEMRIDTDDTATIYLEHPHIEVAFDLEHATTEFPRALAVMKMWRGHENLIAALDLTTPGQAVMQMKPGGFRQSQSCGRAVGAVAMAAPHASAAQPARGERAPMRNVLTGLDVGTSKVCALSGGGRIRRFDRRARSWRRSVHRLAQRRRC